MNRFQLKYKRNVGGTIEAIRKCAPKTVEEWRKYYFANIKSKKHIEELGKKLYTKITEVVQAEIEDIIESDCIDYIIRLVIDRIYDGYKTEINTIYGQLEGILCVKIEPASDEWDRHYNVDFYIEINGKYIGIQIKPVSDAQYMEIFKERNLQVKTHEKFTNKFGGKVFYVFSKKINGHKGIANPDIVKDIKMEIKRLKGNI